MEKDKNLLITGANGQLATEYSQSQPLMGWNFFFADRSEVDITKSISKLAKKINGMHAVLNLAAYTNVEKAEKEEAEKCYNSNSIGPHNLAMVCREMGIPLIHVSTDYVFDGSQDEPYTESSICNPINQYGRTKFLGEKWIEENHDWYYIVRTSWVYSNHSKNFYNTMLNLAQERNEISVVNDQYGSPTSTKELCRAIDAILRDLNKEKSGVYHFSGLGKTTWRDFAEEIFNQAKIPIVVNGVSSKHWPSKVMRPVNSYMSSEKFSRVFGYTPKHWKNALREILSERKTLPIKVGDHVYYGGQEGIVVSTDWLKRIAMIANKNNLKNSVEVPFELLSCYERE